MASVIEKLLSTVETLPSLPDSAVRIASMLSSGEYDIDEVEAVVRNDEAISMTVLKFANSALYGKPGTAFSLRQSLVRLGGKVLMKIVLEQKTATLYKNSGASYGLQRGDLWRSALGGAIAAERIARHRKFDDPELCFLSALLRDIGKLVLDGHEGADCMAQLSEAIKPEECFLEVEEQAFGVNHADLGAALAEQWGIPGRIVNSIRYHHDPPPDAPEHDDLFDIVHAADVICLWAGLAIGHDGLQYPIAPHVQGKYLKIRSRVETFVSQTWCDLHEIQEGLGMNDPQEKAA